MTSAWELAALLKPVLNEVGSAVGAPVAFAVEGPTLVPNIDRSVASGTLQLQPWSEAETPLDRGDMQGCERVLNVICQKPIDEGGEENCFQWLNAVKAVFGELSLSADDGDWRWTGNETITLYDTDAAKSKMQFLSQFRATFQNFA